ncbi:MAG: peptidyl-prolyl cis-trans isomerase [Bacteroidaceae bacterium]|nr:peptidyl-prolyl cis-trans isomerase [Bacteroidaceae bacterium]
MKSGSIGRIIIWLMSVTFVLASCRKAEGVNYAPGKTPLVELDGNVLYEEDLQQVLPLNVSETDSTIFADRYVENWISEQMFYQNAERNVRDDKNIDELVENYRRSLIVHKYQQRLIEQKIEQEITEQEITDFYQENMNLFVLEEPILKGLFIKLPLSSPNQSNIKRLYRLQDDESYDEIEKYCIMYAPYYEFFYDYWHSVSDIEILLPAMEEQLQDYLKEHNFLEVKDDESLYLFNVSDYLPKGSVAPMEQVEDRIKRLIINNKEVTYIGKIKKDLYNAAIENNRVIFHNK